MEMMKEKLLEIKRLGKNKYYPQLSTV